MVSEAWLSIPTMGPSEVWALIQPEHAGADSCPWLGPGSFYTVWHLPYWVSCSLCWWPLMSSWSSLSTPCGCAPTTTLKVSLPGLLLPPNPGPVLVTGHSPAEYSLPVSCSPEESHRCVVRVPSCCPRGDPGSCYPSPGWPAHPPGPALHSPARPPTLLPHLSQ